MAISPETFAYWRENGAPGAITGDTMNPMMSQADGKHYTSKRRYERELNAQGYEIVREKPKPRAKQDTKAEIVNDIKRTLGDVG